MREGLNRYAGKSAHTSGSHEGIVELDNESESVGFIVLLETNEWSPEWMPTLYYVTTLAPQKRPELIYISCPRCRSALHDQVIQLSRAEGFSLKGVIEMRENPSHLSRITRPGFTHSSKFHS